MRKKVKKLNSRLTVILIKAGLSLNLSDLKKVGRPAVMMSLGSFRIASGYTSLEGGSMPKEWKKPKPTEGQRAKAASDAKKTIARNKKARHDYTIEETWEAGLALMGRHVAQGVPGQKGMMKKSVAEFRP